MLIALATVQSHDQEQRLGAVSQDGDIQREDASVLNLNCSLLQMCLCLFTFCLALDRQVSPPNGFCCCLSHFYFHTERAGPSVFLLDSLQCFQLIYNIHNRLLTFPELKPWLKSYFAQKKKKNPTENVGSHLNQHLMKQLSNTDIFPVEMREKQKHSNESKSNRGVITAMIYEGSLK